MPLLLILFLTVSLASFGKTAPSFQGELIGGGRVSLKDKLKPKRGLLVCFWATWCTPCLEELRQVKEKLKAEPDLPLDVLAINVDTSETSSDVKPTLRLYKFDFPAIADPKHEIFGKYHDAKTLPFSVLVSPSAEIESTFSGYDEAMFSKIKQVLTTKIAKGENAKL